jgi:formylglycine-generating enzyme required for sulfatase activity
MRGDGTRFLRYALIAIGGAWACGARTGLGLLGEDGRTQNFGGDGGGAESSVGGDEGAEPPSCAQGEAGATLCREGESCCASPLVSGGTFYRTYDEPLVHGGARLAADGGPTGEADPATVSDFRLDKYMVTVGRFRQFVTAWNGGAGYLPPGGSGKHTHLNDGKGLANSGTPGTYETGWLASDDANVAPTDANLVCAPSGWATWTPSPGSHEDLPMVCANWYEAYAFCIWDGGFLPSEAEWEYAAAGGSEQREFPWGSTDPGTGNEYAIYGCYYPSLDGIGPAGGTCNPTPVGLATRGAGLWGQLDLAGQASEWNLDLYAPYVDPCTDCAKLTSRDQSTPACSPDSPCRVNRGGASGSPLKELLPPVRYFMWPSYHGYYYGFRCARSP